MRNKQSNEGRSPQAAVDALQDLGELHAGLELFSWMDHVQSER